MSVFKGIGTVLSLGDGASPEVFTAVADVVSLDDFGPRKADIDVTALDSEGQEFIDDTPDFGEVSGELNVNYQNAMQVLMRADAGGSVQRNFRIVFSDVSSTQADFTGRVMEFIISTQARAVVTARFRIKLSGVITWS